MRSLAVLLATLALPLSAVAQVAASDDTPGTPIEIEGIDVTGGSLFLGRASYVKAGTGRMAVLSGTVRNGSAFGKSSMRGGSLTFAEGSTFNTRESAFHVSGGDLQFKGGSTFQGGDSTISIDSGNFLTFDNSTFRLGGGSFTASGSSTVTFRGSEFTVGGGNLSFKGGGASFGAGSLLSIESGSVLFQESVDANFIDSSLRIRSGNFVVSDTVSITFDRSSDLDVNGGGLRFRNGGRLLFAGNASVRNARVDVQSGGQVQYRAGGTSEFAQSTVTLEARSELQVEEEAVVTGRGTTLAVPDKAVGFDDLAALDDACLGTAVLSIDDGGRTGLFCDRPAKVGEQCNGYPVKDGSESGWQCRGTCSKGGACDKKVAICCRD